MAESSTQELRTMVNDIAKNINVLGTRSKERDAKSVEKQKYLLAQLDSFNKKINDLENMVSVGVPLSEATDTIKKLNDLQKSIDWMESKLYTQLVTLNEVRDKEEELKKIFSTKVSKNQLDTLYNKLESLEKVYSQISVTEAKNTIKSLIDVASKLDERVKALEEKLGAQSGMGDSSSGAYYSAPVQPKRQPVERKKGFFERLFGGIFSKK